MVLFYLFSGAAAGLAVVWTVSAVMLRYPTFPNRRKQVHRPFFDVKTIAHRGGRETTPENTLVALENGWACCDAIELDVWLTSDEVVVIHHDGTFDRVSGKPGHVSTTKFSELPQIHRKPSDGWEQGSMHAHAPTQSEPIPTFQQVLELMDRVKSGGKTPCMIIEFKQDSQLLIDRVHEMLEARGLTRSGTVTWFSLKDNINRKLKHKDNMMPNIASVIQLLKIVLLHAVGILPLVDMLRSNDEAVMVGLTTQTVKVQQVDQYVPFLRNAPVMLKQPVANFINGLFRSPQLFRYFVGRGVPVLTLNANTTDGVAMAYALHTTAVLTDRPEWIVDALDVSKLENLTK
eukprot:m.148348 g.148348  ORF g.148348 m.148348 type:complete len:346 (-) comp30586_c0_seq1:269-1306(-)